MCVYRTAEGICKKFSVNGVLSYCIDGPCPDEVITNADRIRSMTDEELAEMFAGMADEVPSDNVQAWLEWLQQTVKEGETWKE